MINLQRSDKLTILATGQHAVAKKQNLGQGSRAKILNSIITR